MKIELEMEFYVCRACGVLIGLPKTLGDAASDRLLCPNGHRLRDGWDVVERATSQMVDAENYADELVEERDALTRRLAATKGALTKAQQR